MIKADVRDCTAADLDLLERWRPYGINRRHQARLERQRAGTGTYLIAWTADGPAGSGEILWAGCAAKEIDFPDCPEISALEVWPETLRSQGIGSQLIAAAERRIVDRGFARAGLGVDDSNPNAARLYLRLGYADSGLRYLARYQWTDGSGIVHFEADPCRWLIKTLAA